jgi:effector-binding domain-containing protein
MVMKKSTTTWDTAFNTLIGAFKEIQGYLEKEGLKPAGPAVTVYTGTDDTGFQFEAGIPLEEEPKAPLPDGLAIGKTPEGRMLKFVHRGTYDSMDTTYEAITNYLDERKLDAKELFIEEYVTDPVKTPDNEFVINIYVPTK